MCCRKFSLPLCPFWKPHKEKKNSPKEVLETEGEGWLKVERSSSQRGRTERDEWSGAPHTQFERKGRGKNEKRELERGKKQKNQEKKQREYSQLAHTKIFGLALKVSGCPDNKPHGLRFSLFPLQAAEWKCCRSV